MPGELLRKKIMRRVYAIWFFRKATSPFVLETLAFAGGILGLASYVSFRNVMMNVSPILDSPWSLAGFFSSAFSATELVSKILLVAMAVLIAFLMKDLLPIVPRVLFREKLTLPPL